MIAQDGIQVMLVASTPDTTVPVVQQCTNNEIPVLSNNAPWQPHYLGIGGKLGPGVTPGVASEFNYHFFWGLEDVIQVFSDMWNQVAPGGVVGGSGPTIPTATHGAMRAWASRPRSPRRASPGRPRALPARRHDFTARSTIQVQGRGDRVRRVPPPDFGNFWAQAQQQGLKPTAVTARQGPPLPGRDGVATEPPRALLGDLVVVHASDHVQPHGPDLR